MLLVKVSSRPQVLVSALLASYTSIIQEVISSVPQSMGCSGYVSLKQLEICQSEHTDWTSHSRKY